MNINLVPVEQTVIAYDRPLARDWTQRRAGDWICQGKSGAIYGADDQGNFWLVTPAPAPKAAACECGVKFTGGLHSDWCPLTEQA